MDFKKVKKIAIIGVGFMGGSLSLTLREKFPRIKIWGYARSKASFDKLSKLKILDRAEQNLQKVIEDADIIVLSQPVYVIINYFSRISPFLKKGSIVIDLGSSKKLIGEAAKKYLPEHVDFVGCHPLCGSEKNGAEFGRKDLYHNALCLISSPEANRASRFMKEFWTKLGSEVVFMPASSHDKMISSLSHLPHVISFSLTGFVPKKYLKLCPSSLRDLTRISNSPPAIWADIFLSNKKNILKDAEKFREILKKFMDILEKEDKKKILELISGVNEKQKLINAGIIKK